MPLARFPRRWRCPARPHWRGRGPGRCRRPMTARPPAPPRERSSGRHGDTCATNHPPAAGPGSRRVRHPRTRHRRCRRPDPSSRRVGPAVAGRMNVIWPLASVGEPVSVSCPCATTVISPAAPAMSTSAAAARATRRRPSSIGRSSGTTRLPEPNAARRVSVGASVDGTGHHAASRGARRADVSSAAFEHGAELGLEVGIGRGASGCGHRSISRRRAATAR